MVRGRSQSFRVFSLLPSSGETPPHSGYPIESHYSATLPRQTRLENRATWARDDVVTITTKKPGNLYDLS